MKPHQIVREHFERKKRQGYSLRALARDLDVSPSFVSGVFSGKKKIPVKMLAAIAKILDIDSETLMELKRQIFPEYVMPEIFKNPKATIKWKAVPRKNISALKQWYYPAIISLASCSDFDGRVETVARRLNISVPTAKVAVADLCEMGLLFLEQGRVKKSESFLRLSSAQSLTKVRNFHRQMLRKADEQLGDDSPESFERRLITGISFSSDVHKIAVAKKMLSDSIHEIANYLSETEGTEVYHLSAQLFPLTKK